MSGRLTVIGLGPGLDDWVTPAARHAIDAAEIVLGYAPYLNRLTPRPGQTFEASDNREELSRAARALSLAAEGREVAIVSGGDPGVFAMAAAVFEAIEKGPMAWRSLDVRVEPGVTAMLAAAARIGAPLGHDFCAISLSDNLKPWPAIEARLQHAAAADFVIALYNPASKARPHQITLAFDVLKTCRLPETIVVLAQAVGRPDERLIVSDLGSVDAGLVDMRTLVLIGSSATRALARTNGGVWVYTPRSVGGA